MPRPAATAEPPAALTRQSEDVLASIEEAVRLCRAADSEGGLGEDPTGFLVASLREAKARIAAQDAELADLREKSAAMSEAQADALIRSVEIIDELERTKQHLSEARAAAEDAAEDTQRLADTIFERTHDGVLVFEGGRCAACNDNAAAMLGQRREALIGDVPMTFAAARDEAGEPAGAALVRLCRGDAGLESVEVRVRTPGGEAFWAEVAASPFDRSGGGGVLVVVRDVTGRKRFEAELRRHRDFLDNIINAVPDPLSVSDSHHELVIANDAFCEAAGVDRQTALRRPAGEVLAGQGVDARDLDAALSGETGSASVHRFEDAAGGERVASVKRTVFSDSHTGERYVVATSRDITELEAGRREMNRRALHDALTGLPNRAHFREELAGRLSARYAATVCFLDLDDFKTVNDRYGHAVGDELLRQIGGVLCASVRDCDLVARLGGDEFGVLLFKTTPDEARAKAQSLVCRIQSCRIDFPTGAASVGASWGAAPCEPGTSAEAVIARADRAMYFDKAG